MFSEGVNFSDLNFLLNLVDYFQVSLKTNYMQSHVG